MAADFDLNLLPFYRVKGQEWPQLPGLLAVAPPKRAARGREGDSLVLYLTISGNTPFSSAEYTQITNRMAERFYQTAGSLTSAVRATAEAINQFVLDRNLRTTGQGQYVVGRLLMGILRGGQFVVAQCGPTHVFHLTTGEVRHIHDEQISGRGLGIAQATPLYFSQIDLRPGDLLMLCTDLPSGWDAALLGERGRSPETIRRKLVTVTSDDLNAVLIQSQPGRGTLNVLKGLHAAAAAESPRPVAAVLNQEPAAAPGAAPTPGPDEALPSPARPTSEIQSGRPASRFARLLAGADTTAAPSAADAPAATPQPVVTPPAAADGVPVQDAPVRRPASVPPATISRTGTTRSRFVSPRNAGDIPEIKRPASRQQKEFFRGLAKVLGGIRVGMEKLAQRFKAFLPTLLPNLQDGDAQQMTGSSMLMLAVAIPILITVIASTVYASIGKVTQYQQYFAQAQEQAAQARGMTVPADVRYAWDTTIYFLNEAEQNGYQTQDSQNLRQEAQTALDNLDSIVRLEFHQAIALSTTVQVSRMAAVSDDLYLLDAARGDVSRLFREGTIYTKDTEFECGPGQYGETVVGNLIDIEALLMSNIYNARVMAIDANGTLLYCGLAGSVAVPLVAPQFGWHGITAFSLDSDGKTLYVLDPAGNAIWQYAGNYGQFAELPVMFFGEQVPLGMDTAIDLAANNADLYLLFADGHVTACPLVRYDVVPVRCADPITFVDTRPERQPGEKINDAIFTQISFASADPSLYMLEPLTHAVYRFSPRSDSLELRGQFRATIEQNNAFSGPATAMTIGPNRFIFFSIGNQVFVAMEVP